jgi:hypothetical protein
VLFFFVTFVVSCVCVYLLAFSLLFISFVQKNAKTSEANSFRNMKIKMSYTPEDGHTGRNM